MKTNQVMIRDNGFIQRTKDSYFNATKLIESWNKLNIDKKKILGNYNALSTTKDFIAKLKNEGIENPIIASRGRSNNSGTWVHPYLFVDLAMWVSMDFRFKVVKFISDNLIFNRNEAGDYYKEMCTIILNTYVDYFHKKPPAMIYIQEANMIKSLVTNNQRNEMTEQELRQITYLQKVNANLIKKRIGKQSRIKRLIEASEIKI